MPGVERDEVLEEIDEEAEERETMDTHIFEIFQSLVILKLLVSCLLAVNQ